MVVVVFHTKPAPDIDEEEYRQRSERMWEIASAMPGFISYKDYTAADGEEIGVVRFESQEALDAWRSHPEHLEAQRRARESFFEEYWVQACTTFREYRFTRAGGYTQDLSGAFTSLR